MVEDEEVLLKHNKMKIHILSRLCNEARARKTKLLLFAVNSENAATRGNGEDSFSLQLCSLNIRRIAAAAVAELARKHEKNVGSFLHEKHCASCRARALTSP